MVQLTEAKHLMGANGNGGHEKARRECIKLEIAVEAIGESR